MRTQGKDGHVNCKEALQLVGCNVHWYVLRGDREAPINLLFMFGFINEVDDVMHLSRKQGKVLMSMQWMH